MTDKSEIIMYSKSWCGDCHRAKQFFADYEIEYTDIDVEENPESVSVVRELSGGRENVPTILFPNGNVLVEPSYAELAEQMGIELKEW